jgi:hypothetical protein
VDNATLNVDRGTKEGATARVVCLGGRKSRRHSPNPVPPLADLPLHLLNLTIIVIVNPSKHDHLFLHSSVLFTDLHQAAIHFPVLYALSRLHLYWSLHFHPRPCLGLRFQLEFAEKHCYCVSAVFHSPLRLHLGGFSLRLSFGLHQVVLQSDLAVWQMVEPWTFGRASVCSRFPRGSGQN